MTEAYPLQWPVGKARTKYPTRSRFDTTQNIAQTALWSELSALGAKNVVISTNIKLRQDGLPYASQREPDDKGVAVYFDYKGNKVCFACDRWDRIRDNMQAIRHTINALRGISRWGTGDMVEAAFTGFTALPEPMTTERPWWDVLGFKHGDIDLYDAEQNYKELAKTAHPDNGGSCSEMSKLNVAIQQARKELS